MKFAAISSSRADQAATEPVAEALEAERIYLTVAQSNANQDAALACAKALHEATEKLSHYDPDVVILPGDRFEILGAACAAHLLGLPIAHLGGGDITEGSLDNSTRHAISKLAHIHFPSCQQAAQTLLAMGEEAWRVKLVGDPAIDGLDTIQFYTKEETARLLGVGHPYFLVAYQPATLAADPIGEATTLLAALARLRLPCVFTPLNNDPCSKQIEQGFVQFCSTTGSALLEMDRKLYLSAMKHCAAMIGNSSSGFYEAPSLKKAFVNVGDRQKGRTMAASIINAQPQVDSIVVAVASAQRLDCSKVINPYGDGRATERICHALKNLPSRDLMLHKKTGDLEQWLSTQFGNVFTATETGVLTRKRNSFDGWQDTLTSQSAIN